MGNYRRFTGGGGGKYIKWDREGMVLTGYIKRFVTEQFKGKPQISGLMDIDGEEKQFPLTTGLTRCLQEAFGSVEAVPNDVGVEITYVRPVSIKGGNQFKLFTLDVDEAEYADWCKATGFDPDKDGEETA